jgi:hypothetical protein
LSVRRNAGPRKTTDRRAGRVERKGHDICVPSVRKRALPYETGPPRGMAVEKQCHKNSEGAWVKDNK